LRPTETQPEQETPLEAHETMSTQALASEAVRVGGNALPDGTISGAFGSDGGNGAIGSISGRLGGAGGVATATGPGSTSFDGSPGFNG
jgi:hypothetical protein